MTPASTELVERKEWRCYHCDIVFGDGHSAERHFGTRQHDAPLCRADKEDLKFARLQRDEYGDTNVVLRGQINDLQAKLAASLAREEAARREERERMLEWHNSQAELMEFQANHFATDEAYRDYGVEKAKAHTACYYSMAAIHRQSASFIRSRTADTEGGK
jgi:hypothetical protein